MVCLCPNMYELSKYVLIHLDMRLLYVRLMFLSFKFY